MWFSVYHTNRRHARGSRTGAAWKGTRARKLGRSLADGGGLRTFRGIGGVLGCVLLVLPVGERDHQLAQEVVELLLAGVAEDGAEQGLATGLRADRLVPRRVARLRGLDEGAPAVIRIRQAAHES